MSIVSLSSPKENIEPFDAFSQWATIALHDFNEIDSYLVNSEDFFTNLRDVKRLDEWFQDKKPSQLENYNGTYVDLLDVHDKLEIINIEDNEGISQATKLPRIFLLEKEKDALSPLPPRRLREKYHLSINRVAVSTESLVSYKSNKYSVPKRFIGLKVDLVVKNSQLHIYYNNKIITIHQITIKLLNIHDHHMLKYSTTQRDESIDHTIILEEMRNINYDD